MKNNKMIVIVATLSLLALIIVLVLGFLRRGPKLGNQPSSNAIQSNR